MAAITGKMKQILEFIVLGLVLLIVVQQVYNSTVSTITADDRNSDSMFSTAWTLFGANSSTPTNHGLLPVVVYIVLILALVGIILGAVNFGKSRRFRKKRF